MNYFNGNEYEVLYPTVSLTNTVNSLSATNVSYSNSSTSSIITSNQVQGAIDELFQSVSDGKSLIAEAITDKGVNTSSSASFATMALNIMNIKTENQIKTAYFNTDTSNYQRALGSITINGLSEINYFLLLKIPNDTGYDSTTYTFGSIPMFLYIPNIINKWVAVWCYRTGGSAGTMYWIGENNSYSVNLESPITDVNSFTNAPVGIYKKGNILYYSYSGESSTNMTLQSNSDFIFIGF